MAGLRITGRRLKPSDQPLRLTFMSRTPPMLAGRATDREIRVLRVFRNEFLYLRNRARFVPPPLPAPQQIARPSATQESTFFNHNQENISAPSFQSLSASVGL